MGWFTEGRAYARTLTESARSSLRAPAAGVADIVLRAALFVVVVGGAVALGWTTKQAWAVHRLTRGIGNTVFYGGDGKPWFALDEHRRDVPLDEVAPALREAVIAVEDHRFYRHGGIDPIGLGRAVSRNIRRRGFAEGGSTITQQLARTLFLSTQRTIWRKAKEAVLAVLIEQQLTKDQILELYLNRVALSAGTFGVEAMSRQLYGKRAKDLGLLESAIVAGLIRAPSALSPWSNEEGALARSKVVLARMRQEGFISAAAEQGANTARAHDQRPHLADAHSGYAKEYLRQAFREQVDDDPPDWDDADDFPPRRAAAAERRWRRAGAAGQEGTPGGAGRPRPETGTSWPWWAGGTTTRRLQPRRAQPAATKPAQALSTRPPSTTDSPVTVLDSLHSVTAPGRQEWTPRNAEEGFPDESTLREALLESNNQAAVALQLRIGSGAVLSLASDLGLRDQPNVPSLALGTGLVTPMELTAAYAAFPNGGFAVAPRAIVRVLDASGGVVVENAVRRKQALPEDVAFQSLSMLRDVGPGTASSARSLGVRWSAGGRQAPRSSDAWFTGFTTSVVAAVGFDRPSRSDPKPSARVALPIWRLHAGCPPCPQRSSRCRRLRRSNLPRIIPAPGGRVPDVHQFFGEGDDVPHRLCPIHQAASGGAARARRDLLARGAQI